MLHPKCILKKICYEHFGKFTEKKLQCGVPFIQFPDEITATLHNLNCIANVFLIIIQNFHNSCFPEHLRMNVSINMTKVMNQCAGLFPPTFLSSNCFRRITVQKAGHQDVYVY